MRRRSFCAAAAAAFTAACTPTLAQFNALTPKDGGGRRIRRDLAYGANARQKLDLYAPQELPIGVPIVVFFYGGSWNSGAKGDYEFAGDAIASRGFLTAIPDCRLAPQVRFPVFLEDCAAAVAAIVDHASGLGADPAKLVLMGHSSGAYNAMMLGLDQRYLRAAGVAPASVRGVVGLAGPYDFLPLDTKVTRDAFGRASDLTATQPTHFARHEGPPLLLMWGDKDATVAQRSIDAMARAAQSVGESVDAKIYPGVDHVGIMLALSRLFRGNAPVLDDATAFIRRVTA